MSHGDLKALEAHKYPPCRQIPTLFISKEEPLTHLHSCRRRSPPQKSQNICGWTKHQISKFQPSPTTGDFRVLRRGPTMPSRQLSQGSSSMTSMAWHHPKSCDGAHGELGKTGTSVENHIKQYMRSRFFPDIWKQHCAPKMLVLW